MSVLENELDANHAAFFADWTKQAAQNWRALKAEAAFRLSYRRLSCLHTIKNEIIVPNYTSESAAFFFEAHNDALVSHVAASFGAWRSALHALRSCIENVLCSIYYTDHPIELRLWTDGKFRIGFTALLEYLRSHPTLSKIDPGLSGLDRLRAEYSVLSQAVHGSAANFRMTDSASSILLWSTDRAKLGMWSTREKRVFEALSLLMVCLHSDALQGARLNALRSMLYFTIRPARRTALQTSLHVSIPSPQ